MVKLVVAYNQPEDPAAFDQYYASTHAPLAQKSRVCGDSKLAVCSPRPMAQRPPTAS
jgi:uncharacterized protein (TIGR02118 family)